MSLKSFHILFICITTLFSIFLGYWCYNQWVQIGGSHYLVYSLMTILFSLGMLFYGKWFLKEIAELNAG